jgi:hypothetical protein
LPECFQPQYFSLVPRTSVDLQILLTIFLPVSEWISTDIRVVTPDLLVSIDYNKLNLPLDDHLSILHTAFVSVGLTNKTDVVLRSTFPHPLVSRVHTLASVYLELRRIYRTIKILSVVFPVGVILWHNYSIQISTDDK